MTTLTNSISIDAPLTRVWAILATWPSSPTTTRPCALRK